jgi:VanZ family protein
MNWIPPFIWMAVIYIFSTSTFSEENTASILLPILKGIFPGASIEVLRVIHLIIRKMAHFVEFGILSLLWLRAFRGSKARHLPIFSISFLLSFIYAVLDEFHQSFVSERTASHIDIIIDSLGAASALVFYRIFKPGYGKN